MIKRAIFLVENRFYAQDYKRFGIELLQGNGFQVEVWDLALLLNPQLSRAKAASDLSDFNGLTVFSSIKEACDSLSNLSDADFVINFINYRPQTLKIYKALSRSLADYAVYCGIGPFPVKKGLPHFLTEKARAIAGLRRIAAWKRLVMSLPLSFLGVKPARLFLVFADKYEDYKYYLKYPVTNDTEVLKVHALDYDIYLQEKGSASAEKPIAVFLDEFYPFHSDYVYLNRESPVSAENYYGILNAFFDLIEEKTGFEVVIAAHPRSYYEKMPGCFNGRKCIKGRTASLVRESRLVLSHCSSSLNFANLFYKPVIFMTSSELDKSYEGDYIKEYAGRFNKRAVFIDKDNNVDWGKELAVSKLHYDTYRRSYIKPAQGEDLPFWQIISNRLKEI